MVSKSSLTIFFEDPFWVGLYERMDEGKCQVCKITFGAEPKDHEVYELLLSRWHGLRFSPPVEAGKTAERRINPKRMRRQITSQLEAKGIGTKAQQALKLQREQHKIERKSKSRAEKEAEQERQFTLRQEKKRAKHKGR